MNIITRGSALVTGASAAFVLTAVPLAARERIRTYVVTTVSASATGHAQAREYLTIDEHGERSWMRVTDDAGGLLVAPIALGAAGEIASPSRDESITCYNMAMNALAHQAAADEPPIVLVRYSHSVVTVPLRIESRIDEGAQSTLNLTGVSAGILHTPQGAAQAGIVIGATVTERAGTLASAVFDEVHFLGAQPHAISRSTCTVQGVPQAGPAVTQT